MSPLSPRTGPAAWVEPGFVDGVGVALPLLTVRSAAPGPVVAIGANIHGDEVNGVAVVHRLAAWLPQQLARGVVHLMPSLNPRGLDEGQRRIPGDDLDPNRAYPGNAAGSPAERLAWRVWQELRARGTQLYIDLHTDATGAMPYAIVDRVVQGSDARALAERCVRLAEGTGLTVLREYPADRYLRFDLHRSLPGALVNQRGVAALTIEVGPRRCIDAEAVDLGTQATIGVLAAAGLCAGAAPPHGSRKGGGPWRREGGPRTTRAGLLVPLLRPGQDFHRGDSLAELRELDGTVIERLVARFDGFVVAWPEVGRVGSGTTCATLAIRDE